MTKLKSDKNLKIPEHVVITCDGNRRWAKAKGLPTIMGHREGIKNIEKLLDAARDLGIKHISCWVLSSENLLKRSKDEIDNMMNLAREFSTKYKKKCMEENIKYRHIGRKDRLPEDIIKDITEVEETSKDNTGLNFSLIIDYGGRDEIVRTFKKMVEKGVEISEKTITQHLDTAELPDPDLMIRTGAQTRLSGLFPWQSVYSEFYFSDKMFPAFNAEDLQEAVEYFSNIKRNFGK